MWRFIWVTPLILLAVSADSLYGESDPILELDTESFDAAVYNTKKAHFVEFYSSWCGACIGYAPTFKKFARQLQSWQPLVQVTVVNCAEDKNMPLCRAHSINSFPTLKYFKYNSASKDDGELYQGDKHSLPALTLDVAELVKKDYDIQRMSEFPTFQPLADSSPIDTAWAETETKFIALISEQEPARVAYAIMINFHNDRYVLTVLVRPTHPEAVRLGLTAGKFALLEKGNPVPVWASGDGVTWTEIQEKVNDHVSAAPAAVVPIPKNQDEQEKASISATDLSQFQLQAVDLQSALGYLLLKEVVRREVIDGENLATLKQWVHTLKKYAPGTTPTRRLLHRLDEWIQLKMEKVTADEWTNEINKLQSDLGNPLPNTPTWLACKGSKSNLRGYTCGLWTLGHTITVQAYIQEKDNANFSPVNDVLEPWHQFIIRFLSCGECAQNFDKESKKHGLALVTRREDVFMWLWKVHNSVNQRLSGSLSDDPKFPKQQFPPKALCPHCFNADGSYNEEKTRDFVISYYSNIRTDPAEDAPGYKLSEFENRKQQKAANRRLNPKFAVHADKVDQLEAAEARMKKDALDRDPQREWKNLDGYADAFDSSTQSRGHFYVIWLSIIGVLLIIAYWKYKRNRSKFWKQFYYHNDFKLCPWSGNGVPKKEYMA